MSQPKTCPRCGEEYLATVTLCADCGIPLGGSGAAGPADPEPEELPAAADLVAVRNAEVSWIEGLAGALAEAGIASRVELPSERDQRQVQGRGMGAFRCTLYVRQEDVAAAARVDAAFARTQVPDLPEAEAAWAAAEACPGCGSTLAADAEECRECGLAFGGGE
jgi:hypothetical protein